MSERSAIVEQIDWCLLRAIRRLAEGIGREHHVQLDIETVERTAGAIRVLSDAIATLRTAGPCCYEGDKGEIRVGEGFVERLSGAE